MASFNASFEGRTHWAMQTKARASYPQHTPASQSATLFSENRWEGWMNTPPVGINDPFIADQTKALRTMVPGPPPSNSAPEPFSGGKRVVGPIHSADLPAGKRAFPEIVGKVSDGSLKPQGLRRMPTRARSDLPAGANPNAAVADAIIAPYKPESVKMFEGTNQVRTAPNVERGQARRVTASKTYAW